MAWGLKDEVYIFNAHTKEAGAAVMQRSGDRLKEYAADRRRHAPGSVKRKQADKNFYESEYNFRTGLNAYIADGGRGRTRTAAKRARRAAKGKRTKGAAKKAASATSRGMRSIF